MQVDRPRAVGLDAVRVLGIVAIVAGHVWTTGSAPRYLYAWHVPVFFFLTGWLWTPGRSLAEEVRNRARTLLVPYVAWLVLLAAGVLVVDLRKHKPFAQQAGDLLWGGDHLQRPFTAFWFVTALFFVCVLRRLLDPLPGPARVLVAAVLWLGAYPIHDYLADSPLSVGIALPSLIFVVAGESCAPFARRGSDTIRAGVGAALVVGPFLVVALTPVDVVDLKVGRLGTPVAAFAIATAVSAGLTLLAVTGERLFVKGRAVILPVAAVGIVVILTHAAVLFVLSTPSAGRPLDFVAALVAPVVVGLAIRRTRLADVLIAWPRRAGSAARDNPRAGVTR